MKELLIFGANNPESIRVYESLKDLEGLTLLGYLDNDSKKHGKKFGPYTVLGGSSTVQEPRYKKAYVVNSVTRDCITRKCTTEELLEHGAKLTNLVHPSVNVAHVKMGVGNMVYENAIIQPWAQIGDNCAINAGAIVSHECQLEDHVFLAPGCVLSGIIKLGEGVMIGSGATVLPRLSIGEWSVIGAGAVVTRDVPPYSVVAGNPGKVIRVLDKKGLYAKYLKERPR